MQGFVADDEHRNGAGVKREKGIADAGVHLRLGHARAVNQALYLRPRVFRPDAAEIIADLGLVWRDRGRDQVLLDADFVEQRVVGDNGVVKINADLHGAAGAYLRRRSTVAAMFAGVSPKCSRAPSCSQVRCKNSSPVPNLTSFAVVPG